MTIIPDTKEAKQELLFGSILFILLWTYLIIRANTVFYIHDEIVTKWSYMISWRPLPYLGYIDANNHFVNNFLGGLFIRLFQSDSMWIVRLPSLLTFPLYFWSLFGFRKFFDYKINFYWLLISLTCCAFIIEYFGLARGYGMSMAFMVFAILQTLLCFRSGTWTHIVAALVGWCLAVFSNLTLIPFALAGIIYLVIYLARHHHKKWIVACGLAILPIAYAVHYSFHLKNIGKLYLGDQDGFISTTLHSLTPFLWNTENIFLDFVLIAVALFLLISLIWSYTRSKNIFECKMVFSIFLVLGICNILGQHWLLGINFPQDRAALYLVLFFFGGLSFTIDYWKNKWLAYPFIVLSLGLFSLHINLNKSIFFFYEHFDIELLTKIPIKVNGTPPSTGGRFWLMDNELTRQNNLPLNVLQRVKGPADTLQDYVVYRESIRPELLDLYHPVYEDVISGLALFERNSFLPRKKISENIITIDGTTDYIIYNERLDQPMFFRCSGVLEDMSIFKKIILVFQVQDTITHETVFYQPVHLMQNCAILETGEIRFDFTVAINTYSESTKSSVYLWNPNTTKELGEVKLEIYSIP